MPEHSSQAENTWRPAFKLPLWSSPENGVSPLKVRAARASAREYAALLRDARDLGMGDPSFDEDADAIEKHIDYLDREFPV